MEDRPEQIFFHDEALDRAVGMIMTLSAELFVTRDRLTVLERVLTARGFLELNELDDYQPDSDAISADAADCRLPSIDPLRVKFGIAISVPFLKVVVVMATVLGRLPMFFQGGHYPF